MRRTEVLQEHRKMRFEELRKGWQNKHLTQEEAARVLGVSERTFRRYLRSYEDEGMEGLADRRLSQVSHRRAPVDEVIKVADLYREHYSGFTTKHFYSWYKRLHGGTRSYSWVKNTLQSKELVKKAKRRGAHRRRRLRSPYKGMMLHQDGSTHQWVQGKYWDLIITFDDADTEHYSMFFVEQEGTHSSFQGVRDVMDTHGLFASLYTDRGSHYWHTPEGSGRVDKRRLTQFGRAMHQLGIEMIPAYSPEARGRCERMFSTHQGRLPKELQKAGITDMDEANRYLKEVYLPAFNEEFMVKPSEPGSVFVSCIGTKLEDILCEQYERMVTKDNGVNFLGLFLQIPEDKYRCHYVKAKVRVHRYSNGSLAVFHGPRKLADYDPQGNLLKKKIRSTSAA